MFPNMSSNIGYLLKGALKLPFYKHREYPILLIFSHFTKLMSEEIKKVQYSELTF